MDIKFLHLKNSDGDETINCYHINNIYKSSNKDEYLLVYAMDNGETFKEGFFYSKGSIEEKSEARVDRQERYMEVIAFLNS